MGWDAENPCLLDLLPEPALGAAYRTIRLHWDDWIDSVRVERFICRPGAGLGERKSKHSSDAVPHPMLAHGVILGRPAGWHRLFKPIVDEMG